MQQIITKLQTSLFVVYVRTMSLADIAYCKMHWNYCGSSDGVVERYYPAIYLQGLSKIVKSLYQDGQECKAIDKFKSVLLPLNSSCPSVKLPNVQ